jgi:hypothetical protein
MQASRGKAKERFDPAEDYMWDTVASQFKQKVSRYSDASTKTGSASQPFPQQVRAPNNMKQCQCCSELKGANVKKSFKSLSSYGRYLLVDVDCQDKIAQGLKCFSCFFASLL